jgi:hypothetical protein
MAGVDKVLLQQQQKQKGKQETSLARGRHSELEKHVLSYKVPLGSSNNSDMSSSSSEPHDQGDSGPSTAAPTP